jgi:hypothetical protein
MVKFIFMETATMSTLSSSFLFDHQIEFRLVVALAVVVITYASVQAIQAAEKLVAQIRNRLASNKRAAGPSKRFAFLGAR